MTPMLTIQELAIIIAAPNLNPTLLTPDFLLGSGCISANWKLARQPVLSPQVAQISFANGINIVAQPGSITFSESLPNKDTMDENSQEIKISAMANKYTSILGNLDYQAVAINPRSFVTFPSEDPQAARDYIINTLFASQEWLEAGTKPIKASVNLAYTLENRQLNLTIAEAKLQQEGKAAQSAVLFSGNFPYEITGDTAEERQQQLSQFINNWGKDLETYREIINGKFLSKAMNNEQRTINNKQ